MTRLCGLKLPLHTSHTITSATVIAYFTLCYERNSGSSGPLLILIKFLLIISLTGLLYIPGCTNNKCIKSSTYADTGRHPHTVVREQTHTSRQRNYHLRSYVSLPWKYCVISTSSKMQMNLALLTQVNLAFYHADLANPTSSPDDLCSATAAISWHYFCHECARGSKLFRFVPT